MTEAVFAEAERELAQLVTKPACRDRSLPDLHAALGAPRAEPGGSENRLRRQGSRGRIPRVPPSTSGVPGSTKVVPCLPKPFLGFFWSGPGPARAVPSLPDGVPWLECRNFQVGPAPSDRGNRSGNRGTAFGTGGAAFGSGGAAFGSGGTAPGSRGAAPSDGWGVVWGPEPPRSDGSSAAGGPRTTPLADAISRG